MPFSWVTPRNWVAGERVSAAKMLEVSEDLNYIKDFIDNIYLTIYPVGAIYVSVSSTNPGTYLGGTWAAFGTGRTLVGIDTGQSEFNVVEETGGAKTHTLTTSQIPAHAHTISSFPVWSSNAGLGGSGYAVDSTVTKSTNNAGSGGAHNNLQPYIVVYFWKRTV